MLVTNSVGPGDVAVGGVGDALPPAPLLGPDDHETALNRGGAGGPYEDDTDSEGEFEDRIAEQCARMHGPSPSVGSHCSGREGTVVEKGGLRDDRGGFRVEQGRHRG